MGRAKLTGRRHEPRQGPASLRADPDAVTDTLKDISDELGATGGSPPAPSTPTDQGASASTHDDDVAASGSDGAGAGLSKLAPDAKAALLERKVDKRTKERDEAKAKVEALEKQLAEAKAANAEAMVIHLFFPN